MDEASETEYDFREIELQRKKIAASSEAPKLKKQEKVKSFACEKIAYILIQL